MKAKTENNAADISRRHFVKMSTIALTVIPMHPILLPDNAPIKAVMFDAFVIFNPKPVNLLAEKLFPGKGNELVSMWRSKQFEYCWLRTAGTHYKSFWSITQDALKYAAKKNGIALSVAEAGQLMDQHLHLDIWPDVLDGLKRLKERGISLSLLSNLSAEMLNTNIQNNGLEGYFDHVLSTDKVQLFKPNAAAYHMGIKVTRYKKEEILFAAFAGWDVAGAKWFGYPTYWVNRANSPSEELDVKADATGNNLADVAGYINA